MRLIDADELKKLKVYSEERHEYVVAVFNIDNAPTVDKGYNEGHIDGMLKAEKLYARPIGEWKETGYEAGALGIIYRCPNCGAKMKGEKNEID